MVSIIKISVIFNNNLELNAGSFSYIAKPRRQALLVGENEANKIGDNKIISFKDWLIEYKTKDNYIE